MSGGEPSSIKQFSRCAAGMPVLSRKHVVARKFLLDFRVYGLILRVIFIFITVISKGVLHYGASGSLQKIPSAYL